MTTRFVYDKTAEPIMARSTQMQAALAEIAESVAAVARSIVPRDADSDPHYSDMIDVAVGADRRGAIARVNANKFTSNWIEYGVPAHAGYPIYQPLRRGAEAVGLSLRA